MEIAAYANAVLPPATTSESLVQALVATKPGTPNLAVFLCILCSATVSAASPARKRLENSARHLFVFSRPMATITDNPPGIANEPAVRVQPLVIGNVVVDPPVLQAPMAGFTNYAYRQIVREFGGAGLQATEMVSDARLSGQGRTRRRVSRSTCGVCATKPDRWPCRFGTTTRDAGGGRRGWRMSSKSASSTSISAAR